MKLNLRLIKIFMVLMAFLAGNFLFAQQKGFAEKEKLLYEKGQSKKPGAIVKPKTFTMMPAKSGKNEAIYSTDFESLTVGGQLACQEPAHWTTQTPCGPGDPYISTDYVHGGSNSVKLTNAVEDFEGGTLLLGDKTSGKYTLSSWIYTPADHGGQYYLYHTYGANSEMAANVFFDDWGTCGVQINGTIQSTFTTHPVDQWFKLTQVIDLDQDSAWVYLDGTLLFNWKWSLNGTKQLAAISFYASESNNVDDALFYVDDVNYEKIVEDPTIYSTDFESLTVGGQLACQEPAHWTTQTPCGPGDPYISTDLAHGGSNSVKLTNAVEDFEGGTLLLGDKTSGKYTLSSWIYTPADHGGQYYLYHTYGANSEMAANVFFDDWGTCGVWVNNTVHSTYTTHPIDQWFKLTQVIDLDQDSAWVYLDGTLLLNWKWSEANLTHNGTNQLAAISFYASESSNVDDALFYVDDINYSSLNVQGNAIEGTITKLSDGSPVPGANITISSSALGTLTATTDANGAYAISQADAGNYALTVEKAGFNVMTDNVTLVEGQTLTKNCQLTAPAISVEPNILSVSFPAGGSETRTIMLHNAGDGPMRWAGLSVLQGTSKGKNSLVPAEKTSQSGNVSVSSPTGASRGSTAYAFDYEHSSGSLISFDVDNPQKVTTILSGPLGCGAVFDPFSTNSIYFMNDDFPYPALSKINVETGNMIEIGTMNDVYIGGGLTFDRTTGTMYALGISSGNWSCLYTVDTLTGATTLIDTTGVRNMSGITIDGNGQMYGYDEITDDAYLIDKYTGETTLLGPMGCDGWGVTPSFGDMAWDPVSDNIYLTIVNKASGTYVPEFRIMDKTTGNTTLIGTFSGRIDGLAFPNETSWASITPSSGTLAAGDSVPVVVTFNGNYLPPQDNLTINGNLNFSSTPNVGITAIALSMTLTGELNGNLSGIVTHGTIPEAGVTIKAMRQESPIYNYTAITGNDGNYSLDSIFQGTYVISAIKEGFNTYSDTLLINGGQVLIQNIAMTAPTMAVDSSSLTAATPFGTVITRTLHITNNGDGSLAWTGVLHSILRDKISIPASDGNFEHTSISLGLAPDKVKSNAPANSSTSNFKNTNGTIAYGYCFGNSALMSFNLNDPLNPISVDTIQGIQPFGGTFDATHNDFMYIIDYNDGNIKKINTITGIVTTVGPAGLQSGDTPTGLTCDRSTGILYASSASGSDSRIYTIDPVTGASTLIGSTGIPALIDITVDGNGQMYGYDMGGDNAYKIDKATGISTLIGSIGFDAGFAQGMCYDPNTDIIYLTAYDMLGGSQLRILDRTTGNTSLMGVLPGEMDAFTIPTGWLNYSPKSGIVDAGDSAEIIVTMDGHYLPPQSKNNTLTGTLSLSSDPNVGNIEIPITFTVETSYGILTGTVSHNSNNIGGAAITVTREEAPSYTYAAISDTNGTYSLASVLPGTYDITTTKEGYNQYTAIGEVIVTASQTTTYNIEMLAPVMAVNPSEIIDSVSFGNTITRTLTISNTGNGTLNWTGLAISGEENKISIPASNGDFTHSTPTIGLSSEINSNIPTETKSLKDLLGNSTGYAFDIHPNNVFFSFNTNHPSAQNVISAVSILPLGATFDAIHNDYMYIVDYNDANLKKVDVATGNVTTIGAVGFPSDYVPTGLSCDKTTGIIYASCANSAGTESMIYTIDTVTGAGTLIGTTGIPILIDIAIDGNGQMYGFDIANDNAYKINKATGASSVIGSIGFDADYSQGMAWDPATDQIYIASFDAHDVSALRIFDRTTGNSSVVGYFAGETDGLAFPGTGYGWLSIDPKIGTIAPGTSQEVTVTLDGNYPLPSKESVRTGHVVINSEPHVGNVSVPVSFTIKGDIFGTLSGTVTHGNEPVEGVTLTITNNEYPSYTYSAITGSNGTYVISGIIDGSYKATAKATGYNEYSTDAIEITGGQTTTLNIPFTAPVITITPQGLNINALPNGITDTTITIANTGDGTLEWTSGFSYDNKKLTISLPASNGIFPRGIAPLSLGLAPKNVLNFPSDKPVSKSSTGSIGYGFDIGWTDAFFTFNTNNPSVTNPINYSGVGILGATFDAMRSDSIYTIDNENYLRKKAVANGGTTIIGICNPISSNHTWTGISVDKFSNVMYGVSSDGNNSYLYTINMQTAETTVIGPTGIPTCIDIAIDGGGQMYGYDIAGDNSYKINKETGESVLLGSIGFNANYAEGMGWDPVTDVVYLAGYNYNTGYAELRALDKVTGNTQYIGVFNDSKDPYFEVDGLAFPGKWLTASQGLGSIPPGTSQDITLRFNAMDLPEGTYTANVVYNSNSGEGTITIPVTFTIVNPVLSVTPANQDVNYAEGTTSFAVANTGAGTMNYTAAVTAGSDWLTITNGASGTNNGNIEVAYTENATTSSRVATITITAPGTTGSPVQVTVTQGVNSALLPTFTIATLNNVPAGSITVPVHAANVVNMGSFQFTIEYDPALMTYSSASDWYTGIEAVTIGEPIPGHLTFVWAADMNGINIADGTFFNLNFNWLGSTSTSSLTWSDNPTPREFTDYNGNVFASVYNNGSVTGSPSQPILTVTPTNQGVTSAAGTTTFAVTNTGIGTMNYTAAVTTGNDWLTITSGGSGVNAGNIEVSFTENTSTSPRTGVITVTASGASGSPVNVTVTQAAASVPAAIVTITDTTTLVSGPFVVPVRAQNITNMGSFQFTIEYDPSIILFDSITNWYAGIDAVTTGNPSAGHITFVWAADLNGINIADGKFFDINFNWIASDVIQTQVNWSDNPTPREFADYDGNIFVPMYNNGTETGPDGIPEIGSSSIKVFPNPATDVVNITVSNDISTVQVMNYLGMVVYSENITQEKTITLNTSNYSAGNYLVRFVTNSGKTLIKKMVIIK